MFSPLSLMTDSLNKSFRWGILLFIGVFTLLLEACSLSISINESNARRWPVYYELDLSSATARPLRVPGGYVRITEPEVARTALGFGGLLVVRAFMEDSSGNEYYAYDLACPVENERDVKLFVNEKLEAECPVCESTFSILYGGGAPTGGKSSVPLVTYNAYRTANRVIISNR